MNKIDKKRVKKWIIDNKLIVILFSLSTLFFLFQNYSHFNWDFSAYILNAEYLFHGGNYFEVYRAPLISLILGPLLYLGKNTAGYLYIILISSLFFISSIKLSDAIHKKFLHKYNLDKEKIRFIFYFFLLSPFLLLYGLREGTELLGLTFFQFFLAYYIKNKTSGHFLGLAFLSRYNFLFFFPLLLINKDYKKIFKNILASLAIISPWFIFNYLKWGNPLTSMVESYHLNIYSRLDMVQPFNILSLLKPIGLFLPLFLIGIYFSFHKIKEYNFKKYLKKYKYHILFLLIYIILIREFASIPFKVTRYMFNMALPIAFFSTVGTLEIIKRIKKRRDKIKKILKVLFLIIFIITIFYLSFIFLRKPNLSDMYKGASNKIEDLGLAKCQIHSSHWAPVNYHHKEAIHPLMHDLEEIIERKEIALIFKDYPTMDDTFEMNELDNYSHIYESDKIILIGQENLTNKSCSKAKPWDKPTIENHCEILSKKFQKIGLNKVSKKICLFFEK